MVDLEKRARELLAAEWANESSGASCTDITNELKAELVAIRAIVAALRQQHAAVVDDACKVIVTRDNDHEIIKVEVNGEIVSETIHAGGKRHAVEPDKSATLNSPEGKCPCGESACTESWEPGCGLGSSKDHAAVSEVTRQLIERDRRGRAKYGTSLDRTDLSISDWLQHMAEELLDGAGYALAAKRAVEQPWVVVDDAMVERALNAKAGYLSVRQLFACEREARQGVQAILTTALVRAQALESP